MSASAVAIRPKRKGGWFRKLERAEGKIRVLQALVEAQRKQIQIQEAFIARMTNGR